MCYRPGPPFLDSRQNFGRCAGKPCDQRFFRRHALACPLPSLWTLLRGPVKTGACILSLQVSPGTDESLFFLRSVLRHTTPDHLLANFYRIYITDGRLVPKKKSNERIALLSLKIHYMFNMQELKFVPCNKETGYFFLQLFLFLTKKWRSAYRNTPPKA